MTHSTPAYGGPLVLTAAQVTVDALFRAQVRRHPARVALQSGERSLTYAELDHRVDRLAATLAGEGLRRGDRVAILSENRGEYVELQLAAARLGLIVACQNWRLAEQELAHCFGLVEPKMTFVSERHADVLARLDCSLGTIIVFGEDYERRLARAQGPLPLEKPMAEDGLVILYTSGTTGLPKGAVISQRALVARAQVGLVDRRIEPEANFIAWAPMFHMVSTDNALAALMTGGKVIVLDGFDPERIAAVLPGEEIGWLQVMPGTVEQIIAEIKRSGQRPRRVGSVGCMADLIAPHLIAELTSLVNAPFINSFGSTETGSPPASAGQIPIGMTPKSLSKRQNSFCDIRLVDEDGNEVQDGEPGELAFRGPTLFSGYWRVPEARDFRDGWFHMGDVFVRNPDGTLDFVDRRKYLIKSGGENIYPAEIERLLIASPRIQDAVVVRRRDERWGEVPVAFIVRNDGSLSESEVIALCRGQIANYKLPKSVRFLTDADLPRSTTGKVKRHELEALLVQEQKMEATRHDG
jgi:acyl-CoA synthetase (AMP-forming)/AMP-acid ligase II